MTAHGSGRAASTTDPVTPVPNRTKRTGGGSPRRAPRPSGDRTGAVRRCGSGTRPPLPNGGAQSYCGAVHLLHIAHQADWHEALRDGRYAVSTRDRDLADVGFVHASYPDQVQDVARYVYRDDPEPLCVLVLDEALIGDAGVRVEHEDGGDGELYPHIYGAIDRSWVVDVRPAAFDQEGRFRY